MTGLVGLDVAEVQQMGNALKGQASALTSIVAAVNGIVDQLGQNWQGPDADLFRDWWQSQHRPALEAATASLDGLGQSALNNASEQDSASDGGGGGGLLTGAAAAAGVGAVATAAAGAGGRQGTTPAPPAGNPRPDLPPGALGPPAGTRRSWQEVQAAYEKNGPSMRLGYLQAPGEENKYQCTAWANYRWRELGYEGPAIEGDGGFVAGNAATALGTGTNAPEPGALASRSGHVMVVEQVLDGGAKIRVSEMNSGNDGSGVEATPREYQDTATYSRQGDSRWVHDRSGRAFDMFFANLPR